MSDKAAAPNDIDLDLDLFAEELPDQAQHFAGHVTPNAIATAFTAACFSGCASSISTFSA